MLGVVLETPHVAVGIAIATRIPNPLISIPMAFASHFVLDKIPHWNPHLNTEIKTHGKLTNKTLAIITSDTILALAIGFFFALLAPSKGHAITILLASFASVLPDVIEAPYYLFKTRTKALLNWIKFQKSIQADASPIPGLATQIVTILAAYLTIIS